MNRAKNRGARIAIMLMAIVMCFAMTTVSALGYSYTTDSYDVDRVVKKDNTYKIKETISVLSTTFLIVSWEIFAPIIFLPPF